jgi:hypothetical protein
MNEKIQRRGDECNDLHFEWTLTIIYAEIKNALISVSETTEGS